MGSYGVYVHLPWCATRCHYCSFNIHLDPRRPERAYTSAVRRQWAAHREHFPGRPQTLHFGGGTPSLHPTDLLAELIESIDASDEVALEANPASTSPQQVRGWLEAGITRLSLGIQSFSPRFVRFLNRGHTLEESLALLDAVAAEQPSSWSVDLIFGLPEQTLPDLDEELDHLLSRRPPHVSLYGLTVEPGTAYARTVERGRWVPADEELWERMYLRVVERLEEAGYERYEVSNFALPGHRSRHNEHTWRYRPYAGLGAGAHGFLPSGQRTVGLSQPQAFIEDPLRWEHLEPHDPERALTDLVVSTLRHVDGLPLPALRELGHRLDVASIQPLLASGHLVQGPGSLRLGPAGWTVADALSLRVRQSFRPLA
jgi:oxygen-independent coproporphyrinogen-3 oxidase